MSHAPQPRFKTTDWSIVDLAAHGDEEQVQRALADLYKLYADPLYFFLRTRPGGAATAADDLQDFFWRKVGEEEFFKSADRSRGKLRTFLIRSLKNFTTSKRRYERAEKRGGSIPHLSLDEFDPVTLEERYQSVPATNRDGDPLSVYDRRAALSVIENALAELRREYAKAGRGELFEALRPCLERAIRKGEPAEIGARLGMSPSAVTSNANRLRARFRQRLRGIVAKTLAPGGDIDAEIDALQGILARG